MEKQISIIIPTYNMEKYLAKCLDSLIIPEFDEVEVLVINDGSKDRSSEIAHEYEKRFPNSIRVIDKENGNYGSCINRGIKEAKGKYIKILDADDTFDKAVFKNTVSFLKDLDVDVILNDFDIVDENGNVTKQVRFDLDKDIKRMPFELVKNALTKNSQMHSLMYRTDYIRSLNYHQTEGISYTDTEWTFIPLGSAKTYIYLPIGSLYRYLVGRDGQTMDPSVFHKKLHEQLLVLKSRANHFETYRNALSINRQDFLKSLYRKHANNIYLSVIHSSMQDSKVLLYNFDKSLNGISLDLYNDIGDIWYSPAFDFRYIKNFRKTKHPERYKIPMLIRIKRKITDLI